MSIEQHEHKIDKSGWPAGPWHDEPDYLVWIDEATGMDCMIVRNNGGALCGYAAVKEGHPLYRKPYSARVPKPTGFDKRQYDDRTPILPLMVHAMKEQDGLVSLELAIDVHGGLTYSDKCRGHICHASPDEVWWFGFDCAHAGDESPAYRMGFGKYRDLAYVKAECAKLAKQLKEFS